MTIKDEQIVIEKVTNKTVQKGTKRRENYQLCSIHRKKINQ